MKAKRRLLFQILAVVLLVAIGYTMTIIGRGHTIYLDSKTLEYDGQTYKPAYKTVVYVDGQQVAKLYDKERGVATCIGQTLTVTLEITQQKGGTEEVYAYNIPVPRKMDNVIINLPGFLAGLPEEAYLSEFIPSPDEVAADETDVPSDDDFGMEDMAWATSPQLNKSAENGQTKTQNRTAALTIHREGCVFAYNTRIYGKKQLVRWKEGRGQYRRASALRGARSEAPMLTGPTMPRFCISDSAKPGVFKGDWV